MGLVLLVFWPVSGHSFLDYDDDVYVTENPHVRDGLSIANLRWALTSLERGNWHPLTWLSHQLDVELFGLNAGAHHLTSVVLHGLAAVLLLLVARSLLGALAPSLVLAALFALHPTRVESVAWIAERKDVLAGLLWWLAVLAYLRYVRSPGAGRYVLLLVILFLALTAKPMLVTLPLVLLLLDFWPLRRWSRTGSGSGHRWLGRPLVEKVPLLALSAVLAALAVGAQVRRGTVSDLGQLALDERLANSLTSYGLYLKKLLWPTKLAVLYPHQGMPPIWAILASAFVVAAVSVTAFVERRRRPFLLVGWLWFLGTLLPVIGLLQVGVQSMADRYLYLPAVGIFLITVMAGRELSGRGRAARFVTFGACGAVLVALCLLSRQQLAHWKDSESLYRQTLEVTQFNPIIRINLGQLLVDKGELEEARSHFQTVADQLPPWPDVRPNVGAGLANLAIAWMQRGEMEEAETSLRTALELGSEWPEVFYNLGLVLMSGRQYGEAVHHLQEAVDRGMTDADALNNLGLALMHTGHTAAAAARFQEALDGDPEHWHAAYNLARIHALAGDRAAALAALDEATVRASRVGASTAPLEKLRVAIEALPASSLAPAPATE